MSSDAVDEVVDTSGDSPRVDWAKLAATVVGIVSLGWVYGVIGYAQAIFAGIGSGLDRAETWLADELIEALFQGVLEGISAGWIELGNWTAQTGPFAPLFTVAIIAIVAFVMIWTIQNAVQIVLGVL